MTIGNWRTENGEAKNEKIPTQRRKKKRPKRKGEGGGGGEGGREGRKRENKA